MKPAFKVTVGKNDITEIIADRLISLSVTDEAGVKSDRVEIVLDDRDQLLAIPPTKTSITVAIGYSNMLVNKGAYTVEEIELSGPLRTMTIRANAAGASKGAGAAKRKGWHDTTLGDIAESIADDHGWELSISDYLSGIEVDTDQTENDLQFLTRLASQNGAVAKVMHDKLVIAEHAGGKTTSGKSMPTIPIDASSVTNWSMTTAERGGYEGVKATYYDMDKGEEGEEVAGADGDNTHVLPHTYGTKAEAERAAKSKMDALNKGKQSLEFTMPGDPTLQAECYVKPVNFRKGIDEIKWAVNTITHNLTKNSYSCSVSCSLGK